MTPLHVAAASGCQAVVKELIKFNKSMIATMKNKTNGSLPMHLAAAGGHADLDGETGLHLAAMEGHVNVLEVFRDYPNVDLRAHSSETGLTALHVAAKNGQLQFVREMISLVPANMPSEQTGSSNSEYGYTALHLAAREGQENLVRLLLNSEGVDVKTTTALNSLALHYAAQNGHTNVASLLLSKSSDQINLRDEKGRAALQVAAIGGKLDMVVFLLSQGSDIEFYDTLFLLNLIQCAKMTQFEIVIDFVLSSECPVDTAAKLAGRFKELAEREKDQSRPLNIASGNCETICSDLLRLVAAQDESLVARLMTAVDSHNNRFIDNLVRADLKEVIINPIIQSYLTNVWYGSLEQWPQEKFVFLLFVITVFPPLWLTISLPLRQFESLNESPIVKFMCYLMSYCVLLVLLILAAVNPLEDSCTRAHMTPTWNEWLLLVWISGLFIGELVNPSSIGGLMMLKYLMLATSIIASWVHIFSLLSPDRLVRLEMLYVRDILLAVGTFSALIASIEFLCILAFFGPLSIMIRAVFRDVARFSFLFVACLLGFAAIIRAILEPTGGVSPRYDITLWSLVQSLFFLPYGMLGLNDLPPPSWSPAYAPTLIQIMLGISMFMLSVVTINLLIAMMAETYKDLRELSEIEWKFSRAKIINNVMKSVCTPPPLIILTQAFDRLSHVASCFSAGNSSSTH
ncbi:hypothetical protein Ciccas_008054 [Cichlidogyrus casuarinus]|uniref:Ion transport domain-containing protein n=1 Tax=Cichlidogyrus casuarinus TaxID=1844966 RepID=A0ABD2Q1I7_9PLAT